MSLSRGQAIAGGLQRDLHQSRAVDAERGLAAPQIGRAEKLLGDGDEIRLLVALIGARCASGKCQPMAVTAKRSSCLAIASRAPIGSATVGGSLMSGPGKPSVRGTMTLWVGAGPAGPSAFADSQPT